MRGRLGVSVPIPGISYARVQPIANGVTQSSINHLSDSQKSPTPTGTSINRRQAMTATLSASPLRRRIVVGLASTAALAALPVPARAQAYPSKPVTIVVAYPAGGIADLLARSTAQSLAKMWGQPVVVENRAGANQAIAAVSVMKAAPDGYTLLLCDDGAFTLNPNLFTKLPYGLKNFTPIVDLADAKIVLSMAKEVPAVDLAGMITYAKANPGKLNYASLGTGNLHHLMLENLKRQASIDVVHIPYKGYGEAITDLVGNQVQLLSGGIGGPILGYLQSGALKALAVTGNARSPLLPLVPTFSEAGFPQIKPRVQFILVGPVGIPAPIVETINTAAAEAVNGLRQSVLAPNGMDPLGNKPTDLEAALNAGRAGYAPIIKAIGVRLD